MIPRIVGSFLIAAAILIEALEHVEFIWHHVPTKYANMLSDPKVVVIIFLTGLLVLATKFQGSERTGGTRTATTKVEKTLQTPKPNLILLHCRESNLQAFGVGGLLLAFRNDVLTSKDSARGVIAHISYVGPQGGRAEVNYGMWVEHDDYLVIDRSDTKHLIIGMKEGNSWAAFEDISPQTHYQQHEVVPVGALIPGEWTLKVTLTAEHFKRDYLCKLTINPDGSLKYSFPK